MVAMEGSPKEVKKKIEHKGLNRKEKCWIEKLSKKMHISTNIFEC